jgi:hypothetical protein
MIECKHHWVVDEQNVGVCKKCSEKRKFNPEGINWATWNDNYASLRQDDKFAWSKENVW